MSESYSDFAASCAAFAVSAAWSFKSSATCAELSPKLQDGIPQLVFLRYGLVYFIGIPVHRRPPLRDGLVERPQHFLRGLFHHLGAHGLNLRKLPFRGPDDLKRLLALVHGLIRRLHRLRVGRKRVQRLVQRLDVVVDEGRPVLVDEPRSVLSVHARIRHALRPCIELRLGGLRLLLHLGQRALDGIGRAPHRADCGKRRGRLLQPLVGGDVERIEELRDARVRENLLGYGGHLVAHVLRRFLKPLLGHTLFPPLEVPRIATARNAVSGAPLRPRELPLDPLLELVGEGCGEHQDRLPAVWDAGPGNGLRKGLGFARTGPVIVDLRHERIVV